MARRQPTPEQKQQAAERRGRFTSLAQEVAEMSDDERAELVMKLGAIVTCEGRPLSPFNSCLVLTQLPAAGVVGGFRRWLDAGRAVKKGEHGLMIWVPTKGKGEPDAPAEPTTNAPADGATKRPGFVMGTVFDVTQTDPAREPTPTAATV